MDAASVLDLLVRSDSTLATVESLTGGQVAAAVTAVPGASRCYVGGLVTYATELKQT
ncbi:MAG: CinA family protein, partial [Nocardioides sp.]|uniref:CinA family protein n=1 Tax=Nocardioides sp. TaxID=35761 RepID=UPI003EFE293D